MEATPSTEEIDISNKQSLQLVLDFLEKYFPQSLHLWQFLDYIQRNLIKKDDMWSYQLFVNDRNDIKCVLLIYWTIGFISNYQLLTEEEKSTSRYMTVFCENNNDHLLIPLLQQSVPWSTIKKITFSAIHSRFSSIIENFIRINDLGKCHINSYQQMELDKKTFSEKSKKIIFPGSSDIVIRPLLTIDAPTINDLWTYKSAFTLDQITYEIAHFPAFGAYRNEELISWSLTKYDGSIGTVFTKPEARGLGLATILNVRLASKLFEQQDRVHCFVAYDNIASFRMLENLGYHRTCNVDWLIFTSE